MTLDWIALLLLVPVVVVPTVLVFGFSGCDVVFGLKYIPPAPAITQAEALDIHSIRIAWTYNGSVPVSFEVHRTPAGDTTVTTLPQTSAMTLDDTGLAEGATYLYDVTAIPEDGDSATSAQVAASTFGKTFEAGLSSDLTHQRRTVVQRIEPARLAKSGARVIVTLQRSAVGDLIINAAAISQAADGAYAPAADLKALIAAPILVSADPANGPFAIAPVNYALDHTQPLLIAFDIGLPGNTRAQTGVQPTDATAFSSAIDVFEATQPVRSPGYNSETRIYLVQRIDVV